MTLTEQARELVSLHENPAQGASLTAALVAGTLLLAPLSDAEAASFATPPPTLDFSASPTPTYLDTDNTTAQVLDGGSHLKIFGTASTRQSSGSSYTNIYRWEGNWAEAPALGQGVNLHADGTVIFEAVSGVTVLNSLWEFSLDLDADGTPEYTTGGSSTTENPASFTILANATAFASAANASKYRLDLTFSQTYSGNVYLPYGPNLTIPDNSIDLVIQTQSVPEPSSLALILGGTGLYRLRSRRRR